MHGTIGTLLPSTEARLVDPETGEDAVAGRPGEIWVRGPQVMLGYLNDEEATAADAHAQTAGCARATSRPSTRPAASVSWIASRN